MRLKHSWSVTKLLFQSWKSNFQGPFFTFGFPLLALLIMGEILAAGWRVQTPGPQNYETFLSTILGLISLSAASIGITSIPQLILGYKESIIIKRISITPLRKIDFIIGPIILGFLLVCAGTLVIIASAFIFFHYQIITSFEQLHLHYNFVDILSTIISWLFVSFVGLSIGLFCASLVKTQQSGIGISMMIFFPSILLSGSGFPMYLITRSEILNIVSYIMPIRYFVEAMTISFLYPGHGGIFGTEHINVLTSFNGGSGSVYPDKIPAWSLIPINLLIGSVFLGISYKVWKW